MAGRPRMSPFSSFYNSQVNGARHQDPLGCSLGRASCIPLGSCNSPCSLPDTLLLLLRQFLPVLTQQRQGHEQSGLLPAESHLPQDTFSRTCNTSECGRTSGMSVLEWESPSVKKEQDIFVGKESKPVWLSSTVGGKASLRRDGGSLQGTGHAGTHRPWQEVWLCPKSKVKPVSGVKCC